MFNSARDVLERTEDARAGRIGLGPMTSEVVGPVSSTEKSCYYNALIDFEGITASLSPHVFFPVLKDMLLH